MVLHAPQIAATRAARPVRAPARRHRHRHHPAPAVLRAPRRRRAHRDPLPGARRRDAAAGREAARRLVHGRRRPARPRLGGSRRRRRTRCSSPAGSAPRRSACWPSSSPSEASPSPWLRARRRRERLVARELFERVARGVEVATDDGSAGERGFVTGPGGAAARRRALRRRLRLRARGRCSAPSPACCAQAGVPVPGLARAADGVRHRRVPVVRGDDAIADSSARASTGRSSMPRRCSGMRRRYRRSTRPPVASDRACRLRAGAVAAAVDPGQCRCRGRVAAMSMNVDLSVRLGSLELATR